MAESNQNQATDSPRNLDKTNSENLLIENDENEGGDPLAQSMDKNSLFQDSFEDDHIPHGKLMEIESRDDRDHFLESLGGWNIGDPIGAATAK